MSAVRAIQDCLARVEARGAFATRRTARPNDLRLEVKGVGRITWPIARATAQHLCVVARPARYGLRDKTRLDRSVRDCWEIPRSRITIDRRRWDRTLRPMLEAVRQDLGLAEGIRLNADLHNLLVYQPGQFFLAHQDSEKTDGMIGTLIVILPSAFTGGVLEVAHHGEWMKFRGSPRALTFVAFYSDCHHRLLPVKTGYRVALTYTLTAEGQPSDAAGPVSAAEVATLSRAIERYFASTRPLRWADDDRREQPDRLVYLLDHQYTRRSLGWTRLKGADVARAAVLTEAGRRLDCETALALADVHEQWSCEDEGELFGSYGHRQAWHQHDDDAWGDAEEVEDEEVDTADGTPDLIDLIDTGIELRHWIAPASRLETVAGAVEMDEVCWTRASNELEPFASEHEGYMGNWGNTVDRWYHRAAIVLWPRERTFVIRAKASPMWAVRELTASLRRREVEQARTLARRLLPFWGHVALREKSPTFLGRTLAVAERLDSADLASALVKPFRLEQLTPRAAPRLVALAHRYGVDWCRSVLGTWAADRRDSVEWRKDSWTLSVPALCRQLCAGESKDGFELARWIIDEQWTGTMKQWANLGQEGARLVRTAIDELDAPMLALFEGSVTARCPELQAQMIETLTSPQTDFPVVALTRLLRTAHERHSATRLRELGLSRLHEHCRDELKKRLALPPRARDDWSIAAPRRCTCRLCATLAQFLAAADRVRFEWPLAKDQRAHIHHVIDTADLPVTHATRRTGRPFTLVLEKSQDLFRRDAAERTTWDRELAWLIRTAGGS